MRQLITDRQLICAFETASSALEANAARSVQLRHIAAAMGMSERTLRHRFVLGVGTPPMRYLRLRRLMMAQQALRQAAAESLTVTEIALSYGFSELGRFSVSYRRLFGESPSATLRRSADAPGSSDMS